MRTGLFRVKGIEVVPNRTLLPAFFLLLPHCFHLCKDRPTISHILFRFRFFLVFFFAHFLDALSLSVIVRKAYIVVSVSDCVMFSYRKRKRAVTSFSRSSFSCLSILSCLGPNIHVSPLAEQSKTNVCLYSMLLFHKHYIMQWMPVSLSIDEGVLWHTNGSCSFTFTLMNISTVS